MDKQDSTCEMPHPSVDISVVGRFHGFDLARELQRHGMLNTLVSTYPPHITKRWGIAPSRIKGEPFLELLRRYGGRQKIIDTTWLHQFVAIQHARNAKRMIRSNNANVFIGWSGSSLEALLEARSAGRMTIIERGSSHCNEWRSLMKTENALFGKTFNEMHFFWQRELLEYELADYISIPSRFARDSFVRHGVPEHKLLVNAYGVDLTSFRKIKKLDEKFRVINVGGFNLRKGSHYLVQALAELKDLDLEFWHVGSVSPDMMPIIERFADDRFTFHGHQPQNELYKFYSQASVFVLASIEEGMAMVQPQAMACGLPLICTTNTGGEDLIGENGEGGYVVPIRDVPALKERIRHLYENPGLTAEMGQRAQARVANGLSWKDYGDRYATNIRHALVTHRFQKLAEVPSQRPK